MAAVVFVLPATRPHGLPEHLVGFVEALRGSGISMGPSETQWMPVIATLGLGDRECCGGIACAVLLA